MKNAEILWLVITGLLILGCVGSPTPVSSDSTSSDEGTQPFEAELFSLRVQEDDYDVSFTEVERGENYSLAKARIDEGTSVGSSVVLGKCVYEIAKQRGFEYFMNTYPDEEMSLMKIYFTNDNRVALKDLVGDDYSNELQEVYDDTGYVSVSMLDTVFGEDDLSMNSGRPSPKSETLTETGPGPKVAADPSLPGDVPGEIRTFAGMEFAWIPSGTFQMGSALSIDEVLRRYGESGTEDEWLEEEHPRHTVTISRGFWLGRFEVTNREYRRYAPRHDSGDKEDIDLDGDDQPVVNVSWLDTRRYIRWLNRQGTGTFRLPTEAEWEYACRAGTTSLVYWGELDTSSGQYANVADQTFLESIPNYTTFPTTDGYVMTAPVGNFAPNEWGLHDMIGNAWEYCNDWLGPYAAGPQTDPKGPKSGVFRIKRGGSSWSSPLNCRVALRQYEVPRDRSGLCGFRLVRVQE